MSQFGGKQTEANRMELRRARFNKMPPKTSKDYGLASKGDKTLLNSEKKRIEYFDEIVAAYTAFQNDKKKERVKNLNIHGKDTQIEQLGPFGGRFLADRQDPPPEVAATLRRLRILREALMAHAPDDFCKNVFLFSIRVSAKCCQFETYVASILYLVNEASELLTAAEKTEIVSLLILHVSHCNRDTHQAMSLFFQHLDVQRNHDLYRLLQAWIAEDYYYWMKAFNEETDESISAIMSFGLARIGRVMVECFGAAFFTYPLKDMEGLLPKGIDWNVFKRCFDINWTEADGSVTIRTRAKPVKSA